MQLDSKGIILLEGKTLTLSEDGRAFALSPAVRFLQVVSGDDAGDLVGKVHTTEELAALGAEHYQDSVLMDEVAYQVEEGFVGLVAAPAEAAPEAPADGLAEAPVALEEGQELSDGDLIAGFLLDND